MNKLKNNYYFKTEIIKKSKGGNFGKLSIYQLDNELNPHLIGSQEFNYAMFKGGHDLTFQFLMKNNLITEKYFDSEYWGEKHVYKTIKIHELF